MVERAGGAQSHEVTVLQSSDCWELLRGTAVSRLAVVVDGQPDIFPVNSAVDGSSAVFRTAEGTKLAAALAGPVALEADGYDEASGEVWSVVIKGTAKQIKAHVELIDTFDVAVEPWQGGQKQIFVRVVPDMITGRRFPRVSAEFWRTGFGTPSTTTGPEDEEQPGVAGIA